jgi:hypothetical protein
VAEINLMSKIKRLSYLTSKQSKTLHFNTSEVETNYGLVASAILGISAAFFLKGEGCLK